MRALYQLLIVTFILTNVSGILFIVFYIQAFAGLFGGWENMISETAPPTTAPEDVLNFFFNLKVVISFLVLLGSSLANVILGIVLIAKNKYLKSDAKVLWILGFIFVGFITNIVFFVLKKSHNLLGEAPSNSNNFDFENL